MGARTSSTWWMRCGHWPRWPIVCARRKRKRPPQRKETMSRIHEALKKAEQERAASQGGSAQPGFASTPVADPPVFSDAPAASMAQAVAVSAAGMPAFASQFGLDTLLARCAQMEWKPDLGTMLFMNDDDSARGTEEFRTLRSRLYHMREKMT